MPADVSFADRLGNVVLLTNEFIATGKETEEARMMARELEEAIRGKASSLDEYQTSLGEILRSLRLRAAPSPEPEELPEQVEILNLEGRSFGTYRYATFHTSSDVSTIYKAQAMDESAPSKIVALKVTIPASMTPPHNPQREARLLTQAHHEHVVPLIEAFLDPGLQFVLVFPFLQQDLENLLRSGRLDKQQSSLVFDGLFKALEHIHGLGLIHRDVKPSNILLKTMTGPVYLADFGIAWSPEDRDSEPADSKITDVGTTSYRPLELLFGDRSYDASLDMWAAGVVVAEMVKTTHQSLFDAGPLGSELGLIKSIFTTLGTPDDESWPSARKHPDWGKMKFQIFPARPWKDILPGATETAIDFVRRTVCYEATQRLTAKQALQHELRFEIGRS